MKKLSLILSCVSVAAVIALAIIVARPNNCKAEAAEAPADQPSIVYFKLDQLMVGYQMSIDKNATFNTKASSVEQEIQRRQKGLEKRRDELQDNYNKGLLTNSSLQVKSEKLQKDYDEFQQYVAEKQNDLAGEQQKILSDIADAINTYIQEYNAEKGYSMILSTQGDLLPAPVVAADPALDITEELLAGLNAAYKPAK